MYQPCHNRITGTTNCNLEDGGIQCTSRFNFVLIRSKLESWKLITGLNIKMYSVYIHKMVYINTLHDAVCEKRNLMQSGWNITNSNLLVLIASI